MDTKLNTEMDEYLLSFENKKYEFHKKYESIVYWRQPTRYEDDESIIWTASAVSHEHITIPISYSKKYKIYYCHYRPNLDRDYGDLKLVYDNIIKHIVYIEYTNEKLELIDTTGCEVRNIKDIEKLELIDTPEFEYANQMKNIEMYKNECEQKECACINYIYDAGYNWHSAGNIFIMSKNFLPCVTALWGNK